MTDNKIFKTSIVNLDQLQNYRFTIPTYQRPYVWGDEQIKKLLEDFYKSFIADKNKDYFIGTILTKENNFESELIDGQQRFTTLWLTAFVIKRKNKNSEIEKFLINEDLSLKMNFEIRTEVEDYFKALLSKDKEEDFKIIGSEVISTFPYLKNIATALVIINGIIDNIQDNEIKDFGDYIFKKVQLIKNSTPEKIDLNKLFSTINSAGVQLEQTDIVKANLLKLIDEKVLYGKLWEACENTDNFFERNVRDSFPKTDWRSVNLVNFIEFNRDVFLYDNIQNELTNNEASSIFTIDSIHLEEIELYAENKKDVFDEERESEEIFCRSIISFGQLLLHTYRLHLKKEGLADFEGTFHANRLIEIFKTLEDRNNPEEIKRFFKLLWKVRFLFDKYIIKWISDVDTKTEHLELVNINKNPSNHYYTRTKYVKSNILMMQSTMYFTGDYLRQFWLTPYLGYLLDHHLNLEANSDIHLAKLEDLDNQLSLSTGITDKDASFRLLETDLDNSFNIVNYLELPKSTNFQHYWFQKLEYILYKNWSFEKSNEFLNYRITSRNSVEHIYPQNPENVVKNPPIEDQYLHSFGNLVLLSVNQNSEYSNKSVDEKRSIFSNKNNTYDTLKSYFIFRKYANWNADTIVEHQKEMINMIENHYLSK